MTTRKLFYIITAFIVGFGASIPLVLSFFTSDGSAPFFGLQAGIIGGIGCAFMQWFLSRVYPSIAAYPSMLIAVLLVIKPKIAPVIFTWGEESHPFSYSSETHLYFVIPGVILIVIGFIYLIRRKNPEDQLGGDLIFGFNPIRMPLPSLADLLVPTSNCLINEGLNFLFYIFLEFALLLNYQKKFSFI